MKTRAWAVCCLVFSACPSHNEPQVERIRLSSDVNRSKNPTSLAHAKVEFEREALRRRLRFHSAMDPKYVSNLTRSMADEELIRRGLVSLDTLIESGRILFEHEFSVSEGTANSLTRINGPDSTTCMACHWQSGRAGSGGLADNSLVFGESDHIQTADSRNPISLNGVGVVQMLAEEMTAELQGLQKKLIDDAQRSKETRTVSLLTKGVSFGYLSADSSGVVDSSQIEGVDPDLIIKPFRWKGTSANLRSFVVETFREHMDIDEAELSAGQRTAMVLFLASQEAPALAPPTSVQNINAPFDGDAPLAQEIYRAEWEHGQQVFTELGCAQCHLPTLVLNSGIFRTVLGSTKTIVEVDLTKALAMEYDEILQGYAVGLFSDLKRHDLGEENAARHYDAGVQPRVFLTRRLWDLAKSAPYMHDGRAPWIEHAINAHGGEAASARESYQALSASDQGDLRVFLLSLRSALRPMIR
jgi:hypothetical protein